MKKFKCLKIGLVGCGYWGTNIVKTLEQCNIKNISVTDKNISNLNEIKKKFKFVNIIENFDKFINTNFDCIFLITPTGTHYEIAKKILSKGTNLFIEKPASNQSKDQLKLEKIRIKENKIVNVGYIYNYNIYINYIKKILKQNLLGKIKFMSFERCNLGPIRDDVSCIWDLASHDISTSFYLLNSFPKVKNVITQNYLKKNIYDMSLLHLSYNGVDVEIKSSWLSPEKIRKITIIGEKKMLLFDELDPINKIKILNKYAYYPSVKKFDKSFFTPSAHIYTGKTYSPKIKFFSPLKSEILNFFECIVSKKEPKTNLKYAINITRIIEKINLSIK